MKYEWDHDIGLRVVSRVFSLFMTLPGFIRLDRVLHSAVFYPYDYGLAYFIHGDTFMII